MRPQVPGLKTAFYASICTECLTTIYLCEVHQNLYKHILYCRIKDSTIYMCDIHKQPHMHILHSRIKHSTICVCDIHKHAHTYIPYCRTNPAQRLHNPKNNPKH